MHADYYFKLGASIETTIRTDLAELLWYKVGWGMYLSLAPCISNVNTNRTFRIIVLHTHSHTHFMQIMVSILFAIFLWILLAIGFGGIMVYYVQAEIYCGQMVTSTDASAVQEAINSTAAVADCFPYVDTGVCV